MSHDPLKPGGMLSGRLFQGFLRHLSQCREPEIGDRVGPWKVQSELGRGGSGVVYLAERDDGAFSQQVALKWLRGDRPVPGGREVLARERELLAGLDHPHIARIIDGGQSEDGQIWFAMEYVAGQPIDAHARDLELIERLRLIHALCRAVHHAHSRGLIHGDIKPANVLVDRRGTPRLLDFGIARFEGKGARNSYGLTPDYASPEQSRGEDLTTASDIWQLGRLLSELINGTPVSADLAAVARKAMAESPDERYASAAAMAADIDAWQQGRPVAAYGGRPVYRLRRFAGRNRSASLIGAASLLIMLAGGAWMTWQLAEERDLAQKQAERAEAALHETEAALARAERLHDFLIGLFQASRPDRPRDQLPSTAEILDQGARQAMDPNFAPAAERFGMLSAIGQVYQAQSRYEQARPLIEEAARLARLDNERLPVEDRSRALTRKADLMMRAGDDLDQAEALLMEAEDLLPTASLDQLIPIRITRTWIERHRGRHVDALSLVEPLARRMDEGEPVSVGRKARLLGAVSGLQAASGDLETAARNSTLAIEAFRQAQGEEGQGHVVALANSVGLQMAIGNFAEAERRARHAIELYDRIYPEPVDFRAAARDSLARILLTQGEVEQALEQQELAGIEQAEARDTEPEQWPLRFSRRATFLVRLGNIDQALEDMTRAHELLHEQGGFDRRLVETMDMLLAWVLCRNGQADDGMPLLESLGSAETLQGHPRNRAQWLEARATCALAAGRQDQALETIKKALSLSQGPGQLVTDTDRLLLKARILAASGNPERAEDVLNKAHRGLVELRLEDHFLMQRIDRISQ